MPVAYCRDGRRYEVRSVADRWRETDWFSDRPSTRTVPFGAAPPASRPQARTRRPARLTRTIVPTLVRYLLASETHGEAGGGHGADSTTSCAGSQKNFRVRS